MADNERIRDLEHQVATLTRRLRLNDDADGAIEVAIRDRLTLEQTLTNMFPLLEQYIEASAAFVRTYDEDLERRDFLWSNSSGGSFPIDVGELCSGEEPWTAQGQGWWVVAQRLDVAGEDFGAAGVTLRGTLSPEQRAIAADWLDCWCEQLDDYLASIALARRKHRITTSISDALKDPVLDAGLNRAIEVLGENIAFDDLVLLFRHSQQQRHDLLSYRVIKDGVVEHDSGSHRDPETDAFIKTHADAVLEGNFGPLTERFDITAYREEVMITGVKNQQVVGRMLVSSRAGSFNTFDRDLLDRFADFLRQRIVDFNREWKSLSICFPRQTVQKLLKEEGYTSRLDPTERQCAILYCDISGFTRVSEQVLKEPPLIGRLIDTWSEHVVDIIWESGGVFDKMVGDCVIGLWGPPFFELDAHEMCAKAAKAAIDIRDYTKRLPSSGALPELVDLEGGLGVSTGLNYCPLFVGRFGPNDDFTGFSSGMNNTARLQGVASRDEILCMDIFVDAIGQRAQFGEAREAKVKNVAEPLPFKELLGMAE